MVLNIFLRINIFIFSYLLYLIQLIFIFLKFKDVAKRTFRIAAYICSLSLGITYSIDEISLAIQLMSTLDLFE